MSCGNLFWLTLDPPLQYDLEITVFFSKVLHEKCYLLLTTMRIEKMTSFNAFDMTMHESIICFLSWTNLIEEFI